MLVREGVFFAARLVPTQESQARCSSQLGNSALNFRVFSDPGERRHRLSVCACLITASLYTTRGMVSYLTTSVCSRSIDAYRPILRLRTDPAYRCASMIGGNSVPSEQHMSGPSTLS